MKKQKKQHVVLQDAERDYLEGLLRKGTLNVRVQKRAMALLELDCGKTYTSVAQSLKMSYPTVHGWGKKYHEEGLGFIQDKPRTGRPVEFSGDQKAKITSLACSEAPQGYARWTLRLLADKVVELGFVDEISHTEVGRILKKMNCNLIEKNNGV